MAVDIIYVFCVMENMQNIANITVQTKQQVILTLGIFVLSARTCVYT